MYNVQLCPWSSCHCQLALFSCSFDYILFFDILNIFLVQLVFFGRLLDALMVLISNCRDFLDASMVLV
jgi:hypothetical protein